MVDRPSGRVPILPPGGLETPIISELVTCESLAQTAAWASRWCAAAAGAEAAVLWAPDPVQPMYLCAGVFGSGVRPLLRRTAGRDEGAVLRLLRGREAIAFRRDELSGSKDPFLAGAPDWAAALLALPLEAEAGVFFLLGLFYRDPAAMETAVEGIGPAARTASDALVRALRAERKSAGMLHAIERLTNLYDLSKAFGSTLDEEELSGIIVRKAADLTVGEVASLWLLDAEKGEVTLSGTAVNENYEVETPPDSVGGSVIGDVVTEKAIVRRNDIPGGDAAATEEPGYRVRSLLAAPLVDEGETEGAIVVTNKRGRHPEFTEEDEELLQDLARQAIRALRNARRYGAERKVQELDALLTVSREITSTLDLDRVMGTIVNATSALVSYDRCAVAILEKGRLRLGAVSGIEKLDRKAPEHARLETLLNWSFLGGSDVEVSQDESGNVTADRPETQEKFKSYFAESGMRSFYGAILKDDEGKLGILSFESEEPFAFDSETREILQILFNQATVAVRNAQLYQQVPLVGMLKPLAAGRRLLGVPRRKRLVWGLSAAAAILILVLVPWRLRLSGPARVLPGRRAAVTAAVDGVIRQVLKHEGEQVGAGDVVATLRDEMYVAALADARAAQAIAESATARAREEGNAAAMFQAQSRLEEARARVGLETENLEWTRLKAPIAGTIVTPRLEERVGQGLHRGAELCVVADVGSVITEVAIDEKDSRLVAPGQHADVKLNPFPARTFEGTVSLVGARIREEGTSRFVIAEVQVDNPDLSIKTGMAGRAKIRAGSRSIATLLLRRPARWIWSKIWPLLP
jgi:GAF domain-containing protein/biotin carboxyl carrier protein